MTATSALTQFTIAEVTPAYWRVIFSNPPINLEDPDTLLELQELVGVMESDEAPPRRRARKRRSGLLHQSLRRISSC